MQFGVRFHLLLLFLASVYSFLHETSDVSFYSIITFSYTKYFVHSYTVDVVFTLSYYDNCQPIGSSINMLNRNQIKIANT